jgi:hypothetical protein
VSDTPRTSQAQFGTGRVSVEFCQQLERELNISNDSNTKLEDIIKRAGSAFFVDGSDKETAVAMLTILEETR